MGDALNQLHELETNQLNQGVTRSQTFTSGMAATKQQLSHHQKPDFDRNSEESDGVDQSQNDVGMFYDAEAAMGTGTSGGGGSRR